jgi:hypothetical protein
MAKFEKFDTCNERAIPGHGSDGLVGRRKVLERDYKGNTDGEACANPALV